VTDIYGKYAHELRKKGYSPLPLPPREKFPPPTGWTGALAPMASGPDIQAWTETEPGDSNIALRLPKGVIGIDLDAYGDKQGAKTFAEAVAKVGEAPPSTGKLTSRGASGASGIRLFRLPREDVQLASTFAAAGFGPDIEIIQHHHRYLVGPGSIHPKTGEPYRWFNRTKSGWEVGELPAVEDLPELPAAWILALQKKEAEKQVTDTPHDTYDKLDERTKQRVDAYVEKTVTRIYAKMDQMQGWDTDYRDPEVVEGGWEEGTLTLTRQLAELCMADWTNLTAEDVVPQLELHLPHDGGLSIAAGVSKFLRAFDSDGVVARTWPDSLDKEGDDSWFEDQPFMEARPFAEASAAPGAPEERQATVWPKYEQNDFGNSQRLAAWAAGTLRWLYDEEVWVRYNGIHWERNKSAGKNAAINALNVAFNLEQGHYSDEKEGDEKKSPREKFEAWVLSQKMAGKYAAAAETAQNFEAMNASAKEFDSDPFLLGVTNGTVDLRTGELKPGRQDDMIATHVPVKYDPEAKAPRFQEYLAESIPDPEVRAYLQRVMGYSITGMTIEQVMFIHHGETNNGKSVLMDVLGEVLGEYAGGADPKALIETRSEQHSTHIASLAGPRMLLMSETARGARLSDVLIKNITGGDKVTARKMRQDNEDYKIIGKIHMATNHLPHIVSSKSTNRRIHLIHWPVTIPDEKIDLLLAAKIAANEKEGVLAWLIQGAVEWWKTLQDGQNKDRKTGRPSGLGIPATVLVDTAKYLRDEDEVAEWMDERVEAVTEGGESAKNLYTDYKHWAESRGGRAMTQKALSVELGLRGHESSKRRGLMVYPLQLKPMQQQPNWFDETK
jgi:P4 family phage/plasmid primase-like protien